MRPIFYAVICAGLWAVPAYADTPDFENQTQTITAIGALSAECTNSGRDNETVTPCVNACATSKRLAQSQYSKSSPSMMGIRAAYESCKEARDEALAAGSDTDPSSWVLAGVSLGDDFNKLFDTFDKSKAMVEAKGYYKEDGVETSKRIWFYKEGEQDAEPDVISEYSFQIRDGQVFIQGEADGKKRITHLLFRQRAEKPAAERREMVVGRYGEPRTESAGMLEWGCESAQLPCLQADPKDHMLEVRMRHSEAMNAWQSTYRTMMSEAKGESTESMF
ncbi:MAG: hypothetical protein ACE363_05860 [Alphaproteobacteria bacterium]